LGKTIEAGLVIQEMLLRHRARTVLIICPASLQEKWRVEMLEKFGLDFRVVDTAYIKQLHRDRGIHANPWTSHPRLIASMDWVKSGEVLRAMRDVLPAHTPQLIDEHLISLVHTKCGVISLRTKTNVVMKFAGRLRGDQGLTICIFYIIINELRQEIAQISPSPLICCHGFPIQNYASKFSTGGFK
jgi:hypothetical protein